MELFSNKNNETPEKDNSNINSNGKEKTDKVKKVKKQKAKYLDQKDMNFLERYQTVVEGKQAKIDPKFFVFPAAGVLGVLAVMFIIINIITAITVSGNKKIQAYVNDANNIASYNEAVELSKDIAEKRLSKTALEQTIEIVKKYPQINQDFITKLYAALPQGVTVENITFDSAQGYLSLSCNSDAVAIIPTFINNLEGTGEFACVGYTGYSGGSGGYSFTVDCICNGN